MSKRKLVEEMKLNPQRFYRTPLDVVRDRRFSDAERREILEAWESAAGAEPGRSQQVAEALEEIGRKRDPLAQKP